MMDFKQLGELNGYSPELLMVVMFITAMGSKLEHWSHKHHVASKAGSFARKLNTHEQIKVFKFS